jgi:selenocysteine lyase/cysteine desulfurase
MPPTADTSTAAPADPRLARWRADTPGTAHRVHLNNAGASLMPRPVYDAITAHLALELERGGYEAWDERAEARERTYADVARLLGAAARNVAVVQNSTVAFAQALAAFDFAPGDVILTTRDDYVSNQIAFISLARRRGVVVERADELPAGGVDPGSVRQRIRRRRPALVALTWIPTNSGLVQAAEAVGDVCAEAGVPYLVDACQALGQMPIDVARLRCDYLAATARKFLRGPRGIGILYVSDRALERGDHPLHPDLHGATWTDPDAFELAPDARRFETWEFSAANVLGLGAAARYALDVGIETARDRARALAEEARARLAELPGVRPLDRGAERCAIATFEVAGRDADEVKLALRARGINTSAADRSAAVIDMDAKGAATLLRASPHYYNTSEEIERLAEALGELLR